MRKLVAAAAAMVAASWASNGLAATSGCRMVKLTELPVKLQGGQVLLPASINGKPGWFIVDTGADSSVMFGGAIAAYGLHETTAEHASMVGVGGVQEAVFVTVPTFELAGVKIKNVRFYGMGRRGSPEQAGLLGRDFLDKFDLEFDLANKMLRLWQPQDCGEQNLAYWTRDPDGAELSQFQPGAPYQVKVQVNGKPVEAILDSGASVSMITTQAAPALGIGDAETAQSQGVARGIGEAEVAVRSVAVAQIVVGGEVVKNTRLRVADMYAADTTHVTGSMLAHKMDAHLPDMLLGGDFLRAHRVLLAPAQHRLYFTYNGGPIFQTVAAPLQSGPSPGKGADTHTPSS